MSQLKISSDLFLETSELRRFQSFLSEDGYKKLFKTIIKSYGIVLDDSKASFKPSVVDSNTISIAAGLAVDPEVNIITLKEPFQITIPSDGLKHWVAIKYAVTNEEEGTVQVSTDGTLVGTGTKFLDLLRGGTNFPNRVKLKSNNNFNEFEVLSVSTDELAVINGVFVPESGLKYSVLGTFTPGLETDLDKELIYELDGAEIDLIASQPEPVLESGQYLIASALVQNGVVVLSDYREKASFNAVQENIIDNANGITSLLDVELVTDKEINLSLEHGYQVNSFTLQSLPTNNIFSIEGKSNLFSTGDIPNDFFKGWVLLNRSNMKKATISGNTNKDLFIPNIDFSFVLESGNDFVVVPNSDGVEYEILVSGKYPTYKRFSSENIQNSFIIPLEFGDNLVTIKYRMLGTFKTVFKNLAVCPFNNYLNNYEILANSNFSIRAIRTVETQQYS